jgi:predicted ATP-grasp superfamily ATP-dependent carboligase
MSRTEGSKPWVLVTDGAPDDGQSRTTLWTVRALAEAGYRAATTVSAPYSLAAASRASRRSVRVPALIGPGDGRPYAAAVRDEMRRRSYLAVLPTSDPALMALGMPVAHLVDKSSLTGLAARAGIPTPPTRLFPDATALRAEAGSLSFPVIVKPTFGHGASRASGPSDLAGWSDEAGPLLVQRYVTDGLWSVAGVVWNGALVAAVHQRFLRTWPVDAGMTCAAETIAPDPSIEDKLLRLLDGYTGIFQADLAGPYLIDLNPRSFASVSLAMVSGVNVVGIYCDLLRGRDVEPIRGRPGAFYRWWDADVRWAMTKVRRGELSPRDAARALRPRRHTARGGPESLTDPLPSLARLGFVLDRAVRRARNGAVRTREASPA